MQSMKLFSVLLGPLERGWRRGGGDCDGAEDIAGRAQLKFNIAAPITASEAANPRSMVAWGINTTHPPAANRVIPMRFNIARFRPGLPRERRMDVVKYHISFEIDRSGRSKTVIVEHRRRFVFMDRVDSDQRDKTTKAGVELPGKDGEVKHV